MAENDGGKPSESKALAAKRLRNTFEVAAGIAMGFGAYSTDLLYNADYPGRAAGAFALSFVLLIIGDILNETEIAAKFPDVPRNEKSPSLLLSQRYWGGIAVGVVLGSLVLGQVPADEGISSDVQRQSAPATLHPRELRYPHPERPRP